MRSYRKCSKHTKAECSRSDFCVCEVLKTGWTKGPGLLLIGSSCSAKNPQCHPTNCSLSQESRRAWSQAFNVKGKRLLVYTRSLLSPCPYQLLDLQAQPQLSDVATGLAQPFQSDLTVSHSYAHLHASSILLMLQTPLIHIFFQSEWHSLCNFLFTNSQMTKNG